MIQEVKSSVRPPFYTWILEDFTTSWGHPGQVLRVVAVMLGASPPRTHFAALADCRVRQMVLTPSPWRSSTQVGLWVRVCKRSSRSVRVLWRWWLSCPSPLWALLEWGCVALSIFLVALFCWPPGFSSVFVAFWMLRLSCTIEDGGPCGYFPCVDVNPGAQVACWAWFSTWAE